MNKDYIMRMIEDFARIIARVVFLRADKNYYDAATELDGLSRLVTGFGLDHLRSLGPEGIAYVFGKDAESEGEKLYCSARIMKEDGLIFEAEGKTGESLQSFKLSKELFELATGKDIEEKDDALKEISELNLRLMS